jgi:hypothetical protein
MMNHEIRKSFRVSLHHHHSSFIVHQFILHPPSWTLSTLSDLQAAVARFVDERDWQVYHTPKSLSMSIAIEAAELMEHFQWHGNDASRQVTQEPDVLRRGGWRAGRRADLLPGAGQRGRHRRRPGRAGQAGQPTSSAFPPATCPAATV